LYQSSLVAMMAVAMTVILITGNFDLSVASVAALSAAVLVGCADSMGFWPAACLAVVVAMLVGVLNGAIVQLLGINAFIVTLGTLTAIRGVVQIVTDGRSLSVSDSDALAA
ncbi:ABC transporter permease, partial [Paraburkholderia sp. SIMBA_050]